MGLEMALSIVIAMATAVVPLGAAWWHNSGKTLRHAISWAILAWAAWLAATIWPGILTSYAALSLTGCAGIAVLGARRPGVAAWDFIVASLLIVLWLAWAEGLLAGVELKLGTFRLNFLGTLLAVTLINYLPTRMRWGVILLAGGVAVEFWQLWTGELQVNRNHLLLVAASPWVASLGWEILPPGANAFDQNWKRFRDRYGVVWGQRLREQFNRAAANAKWNCHLHWRGLEHSRSEPSAEWYDTLVALQKRFGTD
jgi:hypothetical protein